MDKNESKAPKKKRTKKAEVISIAAEPWQLQQKTLQLLVKNFYDLQMLRMQVAGRHNKTKGPQVQLDERDLAMLKDHTRRIAVLEGMAKKEIGAFLMQVPFFAQVCNDKDRFRGMDITSWAVILSSFDIEKADTVSKMWAFAGMRPIACRRCKHCQVIAVESDGTYKHAYRMKFKEEVDKETGKTTATRVAEKVRCPFLDKEIPESETFESGQAQKPVKGELLKYNSFLRSKLLGVIGNNLIKARLYYCNHCEQLLKKANADDLDEDVLEEADGQQLFVHRKENPKCKKNGWSMPADEIREVASPWLKFYEDYKHRKATAGWGVSDGHRHKAAIRYMVKHLLLEIWTDWRTHEKLPVRPSYHEEKQGHVHKVAASI